MADVEFDVDSSIAAGWSRFQEQLAALLSGLAAGGETDIAVPATSSRFRCSPYLRFVVGADACVHVEITCDDESGDREHHGGADRAAQLVELGWCLAADAAPQRSAPREAIPELTRAVARTLREVYSIPHPAFLTGARAEPGSTPTPGAADTGPEQPGPARGPEPAEESTWHPDFRPTVIDSPDTATRVIGAALAEVYERDVPADEHDVFAVPAGSALLLVRAHRSLPLVVFTSPLVSHVTDAPAARREVAELNRESLWCRYVFDGSTIHAEAELVDRVFVPVNFKIRLAEFAAELDDVDDDLALRVGGARWIDLPARPGAEDVDG